MYSHLQMKNYSTFFEFLICKCEYIEKMHFNHHHQVLTAVQGVKEINFEIWPITGWIAKHCYSGTTLKRHHLERLCLELLIFFLVLHPGKVHDTFQLLSNLFLARRKVKLSKSLRKQEINQQLTCKLYNISPNISKIIM